MTSDGEMIKRATGGEMARSEPAPGRLRMEAGGFRLHYRAFVVLSQLPEADQAAIRERLASLANLPPSEWPARVVRRPDVAEPLYMILLDNGWRILIAAPAGEDPEVVDIVHHEVMRHFAGAR
jgi:hypothetical protein